MKPQVQTVENRAMFSVVRDLLQEGSEVSVAVRGQSMLPFFLSGSTVKRRPIREEDFRCGNVVFADAGRNFVIHRIIAVDEKSVTLLGDGNVIGTETMARSEVYGVIDCSALHHFFARLWLKMRRFRPYPLAILRRITPR